MPEPVRCDVCGKLYSSRHVNSHKRLAHAKDKVGGSTAPEREMKSILEIYNTLSPENKKRVLAQLANAEQKPSSEICVGPKKIA
jgi:hypothetical protein